VPQHRHRFIPLTALIFTGLHEEHIEAHGSFEKYARTKLKLTENLIASHARPRAIIAHKDSPYADAFLSTPVEEQIPFGISDVEHITEHKRSISFSYKGHHLSLNSPGKFNLLNALAALKTAEFLGIDLSVAVRGLERLSHTSGRVEFIDEGQPFDVIVDYAHTPDSLQALYETFPHQKKICVLGNTGGGRDTWKRPRMAQIAETHCDTVILTDEDPYDEAPQNIIEDMRRGMSTEPIVIMNRREAIAHALSLAEAGSMVLITGKGTDPYIMRARGTKEEWSDARVTRELLKK
jgi:UDP-N-acetylmuramoyl-L-alanyl-D-glutamate--2,6-diaminopimelate ligase